MKKPKYHNIRDAKGRFVKRPNYRPLPVYINEIGVPIHPSLIDGSAKTDKEFKEVYDSHIPTTDHSVPNKTKSALVWFSLGVLSGLIAWVAIEYYYHIFNPCR